MPEPTIVPPPPTVKQGEPIPSTDNSAGIESVQKIFDRVLPEKGKPITTIPKAEEGQPEPATPPLEAPPPEKPPEPKKPEETDVPSFLEQALRGESAAPAAPPAEDEWPEELPTFKSSDEAKARYKKWREAHKNLREELKSVREKPADDPAARQQLEALQTQNRAMQEALSRVGVEQSIEFQQNIMRPLHASWQEAARIVQQNGADPQALAKAMSLNGRAQFEALDEILTDMPESARLQVNDALRVYRGYESARQKAIANAPQELEGIRRREAERQLNEVQKQRADMRGIFDHAVKTLRDNAKLEVLLRTDMPEGTWWNEQGDNIIKQAQELYLENTDMNRVAMACLLAPAADAYRKLWLNSQKKIGQLQKVISERLNGEPDLSESGGSGRIPPSDQQLKDDLKRPFHEIFLREFHKSQGANR